MHREIHRRARGIPAAAGLLAASLLVLAGVRPARATHYVVDAAGGGDFTTISAAVAQLAVSARDSVLVLPGTYAETPAFSAAIPPAAIVGTGGAAVTFLDGITSSAAPTTPAWFLAGFTFTHDLAPGVSGGRATAIDFRACVLAGAVQSDAGGMSAANFHDCDFHGPTMLLHYGNYGTLDHLRFHSARLQTSSSGTGDVRLVDCTFDGPADTLVVAHGDDADRILFTRCAFSSAERGVVFAGGSGEGGVIDRCVAHDIAGAAVELGASGAYSFHTVYSLAVSNSRFVNCGQAIRWPGTGNSQVSLAADTVLASTGIAIEVSENLPAFYVTYPIRDVVVDGAGGHGLDVHCANGMSGVQMTRVHVSHVAGDGIRVVDEPGKATSFLPSRIWNCLSDHNGGAGFRFASGGVAAIGNVAWANGGDGIAFATTAATDRTDSLASSTCVGNGGPGVRVVPPLSLTGIAQVVQRNLTVANVGGGLRVDGPFRGSFAFNDAWHDLGAAYAGVASPADSNLAADPLPCDLPAGDFGVASGSPCASTGVYGAIGARGVGCASPGGVEPPGVTGAAAFAASPNPARGAVEFHAPQAAGGRLDVVDLLGRRVWTRTLRAGESVRWDGHGDAGTIRPGMYLARFDSGGRTTVLRVAWLR